MPPLISWDPRSSIVNWINTSDRRVRDTPKAKKQEWFKGIFEEATNLNKKNVSTGNEEVLSKEKKI